MRRITLTGRQIKAARALAGATQLDIADAAGVHVNSLRYLERKEQITRAGHTVEHVIAALHAQGVVLSLDETQGVAIELAKPESAETIVKTIKETKR